ncbi:nucleoside triphosphate pyrophosphohydrolase [candidate division GN15 bacterium]|nr:nucleoside triphosphate pyrophosphohydrolase [candidate division GN15 bacterium]
MDNDTPNPEALKAYALDDANPPFERLLRLMALLRSPEGCNWDRAQTHQSLLPYLIEEAYEVLEAVERNNDAELKEELGDLLCQIVFHAQLARERGAFHMDDATRSIVEKLIHRHPHVFGERKELAPQEVRDQWEKIKTDSGEKKSVLAGLPKAMPALTMAFRIGEKAGGVGFDWHTANEVLEKVEEEISEIRLELARAENGNTERLADEFGDLLFAAASAARKAGVDPEAALKQALEKFRSRFEALELRVREQAGTFDSLSLEQLEEMWQQLKQERRESGDHSDLSTP